jgi:UDP-N-acetylmuramate dehydrogenase
MRRGGVGISNKHALALVNRGGTATELLALAKEIQDGVRERLGIELHPEPVIV